MQCEMTQEYSKQAFLASQIVLSCYPVFINCLSTESPGKQFSDYISWGFNTKTKIELSTCTCDLCTKLLPIRYWSYFFGHKILYSQNKCTRLRNILNNLNSVIFMDSSSKYYSLTAVLERFCQRTFSIMR